MNISHVYLLYLRNMSSVPKKETGKLWLLRLKVERLGFWMARENLTFHVCVCVCVLIIVCHSMYVYTPLFYFCLQLEYIYF